ncbi:hypothetical protein PHMEG_00023779 [Phytophthora megakarya]|uniref:Uncharacterized protein n=1 Tax=Phytophthora megakarya TaxID=4795 RepID=A0A225VHK1_9STRA|nr:hypothetical protein PHMEG_00023779 [Phytophthora megakarya]
MLDAFMKVFLADGFVLDQAAVDYRDHVLELGKRTETAIPRCCPQASPATSQRWFAQCRHNSPPAASPDSGKFGTRLLTTPKTSWK